MPFGDGTGPLGLGPMTGRGMGYCAGYNVPGYLNPGYGFRGFGRGFGWRRGFGRGFGWRARVVPVIPYPSTIATRTNSQEDELAYLEDEAAAIEQEQEALNRELEEIRKRIQELKKKK